MLACKLRYSSGINIEQVENVLQWVQAVRKELRIELNWNCVATNSIYMWVAVNSASVG